jgi:hypothetical protein
MGGVSSVWEYGPILDDTGDFWISYRGWWSAVVHCVCHGWMVLGPPFQMTIDDLLNFYGIADDEPAGVWIPIQPGGPMWTEVEHTNECRVSEVSCRTSDMDD